MAKNLLNKFIVDRCPEVTNKNECEVVKVLNDFRHKNKEKKKKKEKENCMSHYAKLLNDVKNM